MATSTTKQSQSKSLDYVSTLQSSNKIPMKLRLFHFYIRFLSKVRRRKAELILTKIFFTPQRKVTTESQLKEFGELVSHTIKFEGKDLFVLTGGSGPKILLLHGWGSSSYTFRHLIPRLIDAGFSIVAFDAPAHGLSEGKRTNIPHISRAFFLVESEFGPFDHVIAHSIGGLVARFANSRGLKFNKFVNLNSPYHKESVFNPFFNLLGAPESTHEGITQEVEKIAGVPMTEIFGIHPNFDISMPTLLIYDKQDVVIPYGDGLAIHDSLPNSKLVLTDGLGHRSALSTPKILDSVVEFLQTA